MSSHNNETIMIEGRVKAETDAAILFTDDDENSVWLPKSQIECAEDVELGEIISVDMPEWLAIDKGLV